jgi:hypothetical protein
MPGTNLIRRSRCRIFRNVCRFMPSIIDATMSGEFNFPDNFLWGTATSPTQVEGRVINEWTDYVASDGGNCRVA